MKKILSTCFFIIAIATVSAQEIKLEPNFQKGLKFYHSGEYRVALDHFNNAVKAMPDNAAAYYYLGYVYSNLGNTPQSGESFKKGYDIEPDNVEIMAALANYYIDINEFKKAENLLDKAIKISPNYPESYNNRGVLLFRKGQFKLALENYNTAIKLDSSFALAYSNRGTARYYNQDVANASKLDVRLAISDFNKALQLAPNLEVALKNRGFAYRLLGEVDSSMADYDAYITNNSRNESGYIERGRLKMELKDYKSALEDFMTALELKPDAAHAYYERAHAKTKLNYYNEAINDLIKAIAYDPQFTGNSTYKIAANYALMNEKAKSLKFLKQCLANKYFQNPKRLQAFVDDADFDNLKKDADFIALREKAIKQVKR